MTTICVLACREGSSWVAQAIEQDMAAQGQSLLAAVAALGRLFDARDHLIAGADQDVAHAARVPLPRAPAAYERAFNAGHQVGILPLGVVRVAHVFIGVSPACH